MKLKHLYLKSVTLKGLNTKSDSQDLSFLCSVFLGGNVIWYLAQKATTKKIHDLITQ